MREVKKWNKDYRTGEIVEKMVVKNNDGLQGRATIQLFDKEGNLVDETFTENIIHDVYGDMENYRRLFQMTVGNDVPDIGGGYSYSWVKGFQTILLTTDDDEESEEKIGQKGDIIGYCPRTDTNAGSDAKRGVYNPNESWSKVTEDGYLHHHLVYDFGTSQANGTFNSVFWTGPLTYNRYRERLYYPFFLRSVKNTRGVTLTTNIIVKDRFGNYYQTDGSRTFYKRITNFEKYLNGYEGLKVSANDEKSTYIPPLNWIGATQEYARVENNSHVAGQSWSCAFDIVHRGASDEEISRLSVTDIESLVPNLRTYMDKNSRSDKYFRYEKVCMVGENGDVVVLFYGYAGSSSSSYYIFPTYNSGTNTVNTNALTYNCYLGGIYNVKTKTWKITPSFTPESMGLGFYYGTSSGDGHYYVNSVIDKFEFEGKTYVLSSHNYAYPMFEYNASNGKIITIGANNMGTDAGYSGGHMLFSCYIKELKAFYPYNASSNSYFGYHGLAMITPVSAHTKLPKPVTKTNADTMKVQYDYLVQIPNIFNLDGDYLRMSGE